MNSGISFVLTAAIFLGVWTVFHQLASQKIDNLLGAIIISLTAVILGLIIFLLNFKNESLVLSSQGILFAILAGICALGIDFFVLKSYSSGLPISFVGPTIIGGSIGIAALIGFFMGDKVTLLKILGIIFIAIGSIILSIIT